MKLTSSDCRGFSLIELAFALVIFGIISSSLLYKYNIHVKQRRYGKTITALSKVNSALQNYVAAHGYYPCPADQSISQGDVDYGVGINCSPLGSIPPCAGLGQGVCRTTGGTVVVIGGVPFQDLHLSGDNAYDAWGSRLTYGLTYALRPTGSPLSPLPAGEITVEQTDDSGTVITDAHYILVAPGPLGAGGFNRNAIITRVCDTAQKEGENCDQDDIFASDGNSRWRNHVTGINYFDDFVRYAQDVNAAEWNIEVTSPSDLRFFYDRVGIGITDADSNTDLHVVGDIKIDDWAKSGKVCNGDTNSATAECFDPEDIAGSKSDMRCDSGDSSFGYQAMVGVAEEKVKCTLTIEPTASTASSCATGYMAVGIKPTGELDCQLY